ncbi:MAG: amino acid aminotransferase [Pseudomonadota bacterium]
MMFDALTPNPPDPILALMERYRADTSPQKLDLGIGVYTDEHGVTPVFPSVLEGERRVLAKQTTKTYVGIAGDPQFCDLHQALTFGEDHPARRDGRLRTIQTPGGSGGLRVAAELLNRAAKPPTVWVSTPTWANHVPLLSSVGVQLKKYRYYDETTHAVNIEGMLEDIAEAHAGDLILLHGCCHNPTGADLTQAQWTQVTDLILERNLVPFVDLAYQGFGRDVDGDVAGVRAMAERVPEMLVVASCSKNFSLYRERTGSLSVLSRDAATAGVVASNMSAVARSMYSMPPHHGAGIVAEVLSDADLKAQWRGEVTAVCKRVAALRSTLAEALNAHVPGRDFTFLTQQQGMFSLLGVPREVIDRLSDEHHIYIVGSGRMNLAGLPAQRVGDLAAAVAESIEATAT